MADFDVITLFLAAPNDMKTERDIVEAVARNLNDQMSSANFPIMFRIQRWERAPRGLHAGGAQGLIDEHFPPGICDIFVAILGKKFGEPTVDNFTHTEHEVCERMDLWRESGRPEGLLYFREGLAASNDAEKRQMDAVQAFKLKMFAEGVCGVYEDEASFRQLVRDDLWARGIAPRLKPLNRPVIEGVCYVDPVLLRSCGAAELAAVIRIQFIGPLPDMPTPYHIALSTSPVVNITNRIVSVAESRLCDCYLKSSSSRAKVALVLGRQSGPASIVFDDVEISSSQPEIEISNLRINCSQIDGAGNIRLVAKATPQRTGAPPVNIRTAPVVGITVGVDYRFDASATGSDFSESSQVVWRDSEAYAEFLAIFEESRPGVFRNAADEMRLSLLSGVSLVNSSIDPVAQHGTRLLLRFSGIPANIQLLVTDLDLQPAVGTTHTSQCERVDTDANGAGFAARQVGNTLANTGIRLQPIPTFHGAAIATWEWTAPQSALQRRAAIGFRLAGDFGNMRPFSFTVSGHLGPLTATSHAVQKAPIPRFVEVPRMMRTLTVVP